ncbi:MAG: hypothetical protein KGP12_05200 [Actinomycetales bacterium]|nr:hypothetical protein [Actinomycetales bacterium]
MNPLRRGLAMGGLVLVGLAVGIMGGFVQADRWVVAAPWGVLAVPWGMVIVLFALVAAIRGACWLVRTRWGGGVLFAGWVTGTLMMASQTPSGDLAISAGGRQWTYLLAGVVLGSASVTIPVVEHLWTGRGHD